jgi:hypothetical protein
VPVEVPLSKPVPTGVKAYATTGVQLAAKTVTSVKDLVNFDSAEIKHIISVNQGGTIPLDKIFPVTSELGKVGKFETVLPGRVDGKEQDICISCMDHATKYEKQFENLSSTTGIKKYTGTYVKNFCSSYFSPPKSNLCTLYGENTMERLTSKNKVELLISAMPINNELFTESSSSASVSSVEKTKNWSSWFFSPKLTSENTSTDPFEDPGTFGGTRNR